MKELRWKRGGDSREVSVKMNNQDSKHYESSFVPMCRGLFRVPAIKNETAFREENDGKVAMKHE